MRQSKQTIWLEKNIENSAKEFNRKLRLYTGKDPFHKQPKA